MKQVYLLSVHRWLESLSIASAVLANPLYDVMFIDPSDIDLEMEQLNLLAERLPVKFIDSTGSNAVMPALEQAAIKYCQDEMFSGKNWLERLAENFGKPAGICSAVFDSPLNCLRAATAAVRLGYYFIPLGENIDTTELSSVCQELLWFSEEKELKVIAADKDAEKYRCIRSEKETIALLQEKGFEVDYLVICNSADLGHESKRGSCLGELWVKGLSMHALLMASYRNIFICDAHSAVPDPYKIEKKANRLVQESGVKPLYQVVLGSPAVIPFFYEEKKAIGAVTEEMIRDIHLRMNSDLFADLAEGRLMQNTPGGLSAQLISTKRYQAIQERLASSGRDVTIIGPPHVDTGIIFSSDNSLMEAQLLPLLDEAGFNVQMLEGREAHYQKIGEALKLADFLLFTGHGGPEGLHTHGKTLNRDDLPLLPPLVAYASACSTVGLVPHWYSKNEGIDWQGIEVDSRQVIGLSFVEKGALCFIGGATVEDLQYSTSIYSIFMEALLIKGLSVGEAVRATRNFISLYATILMQKNPEAYRKYRYGTANAIHQQILLGDPAFTPLSRAANISGIDVSVGDGGLPEKEVTVDIAEKVWRRTFAAVNEKDPSKHYYRCRNVEVNTPYGENVISWGDYYRVAPDADDISESAVMSSFLHLTLDLETEEAPISLKLKAVEASDPTCLLCDHPAAADKDLLSAASCFKLPYLLQPPLEVDMQEGWAFSIEELADGRRMHWLVPLLLIDEKNRSIRRLQKMVFKIETEKAKKIKGRVNNLDAASALVCAGFPTGKDNQGQAEDGKDNMPVLKTPVFALTENDGSFEIVTATSNISFSILEQYPLYELLEPYKAYNNRFYSAETSTADSELCLEAEVIEGININGVIVDSTDGKTIGGALVRVFRGEYDPVGDPLVEAYAGEVVSGEDGRFHFCLPAGKYLLYAAASFGQLAYKSGSWPLETRKGEDYFRVFALDQAAVVKGNIKFEGHQPVEPIQVALKRFPKKKGEGALVKVPVQRDGNYHCLVNFQDRFSIVIEEEGWQSIEDTNDDLGYKLGAQEVLTRDYLLKPV